MPFDHRNRPRGSLTKTLVMPQSDGTAEKLFRDLDD
jgi:hypothetical protein